MSICCENGESILQTAGWRGHETLSARTTKGRKQVNVAVQMRMTRTAIMMTFVGTETLVTQLVNERSRVHANRNACNHNKDHHHHQRKEARIGKNARTIGGGRRLRRKQDKTSDEAGSTRQKTHAGSASAQKGYNVHRLDLRATGDSLAQRRETRKGLLTHAIASMCNTMGKEQKK
jgi:hypothetical protein